MALKKAEQNADHKADLRTELEAENKADLEAENKTNLEADNIAGLKAENKTELEAENKTSFKAAHKTGNKTDRKASPKTGQITGRKASPKTRQITGRKASPKAGHKTSLKTDFKKTTGKSPKPANPVKPDNSLNFQRYFEGVFTSMRASAKWILFGILCGAIVGTIASVFAIAIRTGTQLRAAHPYLLFGLPVAGLVIVFAYHKLGFAKDGGTNTILEAIRDGEYVPIQMAPLIFIGTVLTHMFGGSAGREGAALQIGGSIGNGIGRFLRFQKSDTKRTIMCGMSAAFSALFGTPLAAAILPIEISTVGIMYYSSLVPCVLSSLVAYYIARAFGLSGEAYRIGTITSISLPTALLTVLLSGVCALAAILFCTAMDKISILLRKYFKNDFARVAAGGVIVILMTLAVGSQTYNGAGANIIELCFEGDPSKIFILAFLLKIIFTAFTLGSGYKGGEIVPALFIGATLGVHFGNLVGISPALFAALGMGALFCGVTNCPIASLLICFEMFGFEAMPYFLLAISFTYLFSGNFGLYHGQVIRYSKYEPGKINEHAHH